MGRRLGQHFLSSTTVAKKCITVSAIKKGDFVFEIGGGRGIITNEILKKGAHVTVLEKDPSLTLFLKKRFHEEIKKGKLVINEGDIRNGVPQFSSPYSVISNIPYYLTGDILRTLLSAKKKPHGITLLVQKEVAERITDKKKESILSLSVKLYGTPTYIETVPRSLFLPPPRVDSALIDIKNIKARPLKVEEYYFDIIKRAFAHKRKLLSSNISKKEYEFISSHCGASPSLRAEDVPFSVWLLKATTSTFNNGKTP